MTMQRPIHLIPFNKGSQRPQHVIFFDTETKPIPISDKEDKQILKMGWACYVPPLEPGHKRRPQWGFFTTEATFWSFVEKYAKPRRKLYLVAHNVGFDFRIVEGFKYTQKHGWDLTFFYNKGKTCLLTYRKDKCTLQVLDMTNFYPMSLEVVGQTVGLEKQSIDFTTASDITLSEYCHRDVEIMIEAWKVWLNFLDTHDLGSFKHTLPAQAFGAFRHRFMKHRIEIHNNDSVCQLERAAYKGGRVEVFWQGKRTGETFYQIDVNSMYAYVMQQNNYPTQLRQSWNTMSLRRFPHILKEFMVVARVVIETKEPVFPIFTGTRNVYPIGRYETVLTTPELHYALAQDMIILVKQIAWYKSRNIFQEYSTYFAELKQKYDRENNKAFRTIAKLFGNSLYGKFGQRGISTKIVKGNTWDKSKEREHVIVESIEGEITTTDDGYEKRVGAKIISHNVGRSYRIGDIYVNELTEGESYNSFPAIAAHVTAYARMYLWSLMRIAGRENVYYTDTDCLIVNQAGYDNLLPLLDDCAIGYLKVEKQAENLAIYAAKDYMLGDKVRIKGIRRNAKQIADNVFEQVQFLGLPGAIQKGAPDLVTIKRLQKTLHRKVLTGIVGEDGWVTPFRFPL